MWFCGRLWLNLIDTECWEESPWIAKAQETTHTKGIFIDQAGPFWPNVEAQENIMSKRRVTNLLINRAVKKKCLRIFLHKNRLSGSIPEDKMKATALCYFEHYTSSLMFSAFSGGTAMRSSCFTSYFSLGFLRVGWWRCEQSNVWKDMLDRKNKPCSESAHAILIPVLSVETLCLRKRFGNDDDRLITVVTHQSALRQRQGGQGGRLQVVNKTNKNITQIQIQFSLAQKHRTVDSVSTHKNKW